MYEWLFGGGRPGRPALLSLVKGGLLLLAAVCVLAVALAARGEAGAGAYEEVTVQPGDTLWSIAASRRPDSDVRAGVGEIMRVNGLKDPVIQPGDHLRVPSG
jgi:hypothetical protein